MSLFAKIFGGGKEHHYSEGLALFEAGRFAEAIDRLRVASEGRGRSPDSSLASFYLGLALVAEGRRLLQANRAQEAASLLAEAAEASDTYPDLQFLLGTAQGLSGDWDQAYRAARRSRRLNPDYLEARLLEYCALLRLQRSGEAEDRLRELGAEGRWQDHWILTALAVAGEQSPQAAEPDVAQLLLRAVAGPRQPHDVAGAVALCRAGDWEGGLLLFANLIKEHPDYPDFRVKYAAALYHLGRLQEAETEVESALALNPGYRAAIYLKSLLLADEGRIEAAWRFLSGQRVELGATSTGNHEELFGAYLEAVLALLTGRSMSAPHLLDDWGDLVQGFARAVLVEAAVEDLGGRRDGCRQRLEKLVAAWPAEAEYRFLLAAHHMDCDRHDDARSLLADWPASPAGKGDRRPLYLRALLELEREHLPDLPDADTVDSAPAWQFLSARADLLRQDSAACWRQCQRLIDKGYLTEAVVGLQVAAAVVATPGAEEVADTADAVPSAEAWEGASDWRPPPVAPLSILAGWTALQHRAAQTEGAEEQLATVRGIHPEQLSTYWLSAPFWLEPVRRWLG